MSVLDRVEAGFDRAIDAVRRRSRVFDHVWRALVRFSDVLGGRLAAAISYYAFFAAFSLAVLAYSIFGRLLDAGALVDVNEYLRDTLPWVAETAVEVGRGEVTIIAGLALLISGIGWVEALRSSLRAVWLLDQHPGHWLLRRLVDLGMLIGLGLLLLLSLATTSGLDRLLVWLAPDTDFGQTLLRPFGPALEFLVNVVLAGALLTAVSRMHLSPRRLIVPVLVIAVGIQLLNTAGRAVISISKDRPVYALVTNAVGLLIYLYLLNQVILFGAALAATASAGKARDLGAGAAGIARGRVVAAPHVASVEAPHVKDADGVDAEDSGKGIGEPHRSPEQKQP